MPKIPSAPKPDAERVSFCDGCGTTIAWGQKQCVACQAATTGSPRPTRSSSAHEYRTFPFVATTTHGASFDVQANETSQQLDNAINRLERTGWEYVGMESVWGASNPGCLALFGRKGEQTKFDMIVARRKRKDA